MGWLNLGQKDLKTLRSWVQVLTQARQVRWVP